jgi:hypothetical protein
MREKTQISKIRNEKGKIVTNTKDIQGITTDFFENLYSNKLENHEEMEKLLDTYDYPKLNQEDINHLNRSVKHNEIKAAIKSLLKKKSPGPDGFSAEFYQTFKEELTPMLLKLFHEIEWKECYHTHSMKPVFYSSQNQTRTHPKRSTTGQSL